MGQRVIHTSFALLMVLSPFVAGNAITTEESEYLSEKQRGDYRGAIEALARWNRLITEPAYLELNAFRIRELAVYPELYDTAEEALSSLRRHCITTRTPLLRDRIDLFLNELHLARGNTAESDRLMAPLGFLSFYVLGPFNNRSSGEFEQDYLDGKAPQRERYYHGRYGPVTWWHMNPDRHGTININDIAEKLRGGLYYLQQDIDIPAEGRYTLLVGKTGATDITIDGTVVFASRGRHGFRQDQYCVTVALRKGRHSILVKTGDAESRIRFSMRIRGTDGTTVRGASGTGEPSVGPVSEGSVSEDLFPALGYFCGKGSGREGASFHAGYLFVQSHLSTPSNREHLEFLTAVKEGDPLYSSANFYLAALQETPEQREHFLLKSYSSDGDNYESLFGLVRLSVDHDHCEEAWSHLQKFRADTRGFPFRRIGEAGLFMKRQWDHAMLKAARSILSSEYPSAGVPYIASYYMGNREFGKALRWYEKMVRRRRTDLRVLSKLLACYRRTGDFASAERELLKSIDQMPNRVSLRLKLARLSANVRGPESAIPYLSSALSLAPDHAGVLKELGYLYHRLGREPAARYHCARSLSLNPDDRRLAVFLSSISRERTVLDTMGYAEDLRKLVEESYRYGEESAVILLNETLMAYQENGSFEKRVRRVIRVNGRDSFDDFKNQFILYNPKIESVENIRCTLANGTRTIRLSGTFTKSVSDPESRMYYDVRSVVVPVHGLCEGSIIDFRYTLKSRSGDVYRNYISEKFTVGSSYRTLKSVIAVVYPAGSTMHFRRRGIGAGSIRQSSMGVHRVFRCTVSNSPPLGKEQGMPHLSTILPALYVNNKGSWQQISQWYISLMRDRIVMSAEMTGALNGILAGTATPEERIRAIYDHVTREVRYVGLEFGLGGIQPRGTDITYHSRMGDCKDIALVLVAMLRAAGFEAYLALVRTRNDGIADTAIPSLEEFNHALCYVNFAGGIFLDGTANDCGIRELPTEDRDVRALVIRDGGAGAGTCSLVATTSDFYLKNRIEIHSDMKVQDDGTMVVTRRLLKQGSLAPLARQSLGLPGGIKLISLTEYWNRLYPGSRISDYEIINKKKDSPVEYRYRITIPGYAKLINGRMFLEPFSVRSDYYGIYCTARQRRYPIQLDYPVEVASFNTITAPEGYGCSTLPTSRELSCSMARARFRYGRDGNRITATSLLQIDDYEIPAGEYRRFKEFARGLGIAEHELLFYRQTGKAH
ncbi:MAG: DUF3857 domain-containing protein [Spirochaetes bacterium]|nr:DUF3857 domain-containing protein [Spirochaetota bacterium]